MYDFFKNNSRKVYEFSQKIRAKMYEPVSWLDTEVFVTKEPVDYCRRMTGKRASIVKGQKWADIFDCGWFHFTGTVPPEAKGKKVCLLLDVNGEMCIYNDKGEPIRGLTNGSSTFDFKLGMPGKRVFDFLECAQGGEKVDIWADAGCNDLFGVLCKDGTLEDASVAVCRDDVRKLFYDYEVLLDLCNVLPEGSARKVQIFDALYKISMRVSKFDDKEISDAISILAPHLNKKGGDECFKVYAIGHAHLDLAWLWPIRETKRKAVRTFSTAIDLLEKYPDYIFGASQPQAYQWVKDSHPCLYQKIKEKVKAGRWELQGGMWVESDTNLAGGESLIRQFIYGKKFYAEEFGIDVNNLWLPDVFGYSGALPQIMKKCGIDYFMTQKLSWNDTNKFPHHTFHWKGIDGSSVLTHMLPEGTYSSPALPSSVHKSEMDYLDKNVSDKCLMLYGIGDGGGGPGKEHLESLSRIRDLKGIAPVVNATGKDFFDAIDKSSDKYSEWQGELYLEKHRGTYTTIADVKKFNRKIEYLLRELEFTSTAASLYGMKYPAAELEEIWKEVLLYQFHDILPGSSIMRVYEECIARYKILSNRLNELISKARDVIVSNINVGDAEGNVAVFNSLSWQRQQWLECGGKWKLVTVPAMGWIVVDFSHEDELPVLPPFTENTIESDIYKIVFNADGSICSIYDKIALREILKNEQNANRFSLYSDDGDAWDFQNDYAQKAPEYFKLISSEAITDGPRIIVKQYYRYNRSQITQQIILTHGSRRIDFQTHVDWHEDGKMLRTAFPVNIHASEATCDIQYGSIKRPTHCNTSWDVAKFEVCAHKYVDVSQADYGVALMNDSKYGYCVFDNTLDLNLLRSTNYPAKDADKGEHQFTYSLYAHQGNVVDGDVVRTSYEMNIPLSCHHLTDASGSEIAKHSMLTVDGKNVIIEAVKKAEDGDAVIIRMYETQGTRANVNLACGFNVKSAFETNMLEKMIAPIAVSDDGFNLSFSPYEIKTVALLGSKNV